MSKLNFDKEKYIRVMNSEGAGAALTQLQNDIIRWENEAFEGKKGYQPQMWEEINIARDFSREIWDLSLQNSLP